MILVSGAYIKYVSINKIVFNALSAQMTHSEFAVITFF